MLYLHEEYELLLRKIPREKINSHMEKDTESLLPLIEYWQEKGMVIDKRPEVIAGAMRALFTTALHKKEIGEEIYDDAVGLLIDLFCKGLTERGDGNCHLS